MNIPRPVLIGGGVLAFVLAVVAMVPPTKPIGGAKVDPSAHHGPADLPPPVAQPPLRPVQQPAHASPGGYSGDAATVAATAPDGDATANEDTDAASADRDDRPRGEAFDPDYRAGYRWAAQRGIRDPRDCRSVAAGPGADGCLGYLRDARDRGDGDDDADDRRY